MSLLADRTHWREESVKLKTVSLVLNSVCIQDI